jgi:putative acetyltransferase
VRIIEDDLETPAVIRLLEEHLEDMHAITPPESVHALALERLKAPEITFFAAWDGDHLLGCGAIKVLDEDSAEIKSMRTASAHRGRGVASQILEHLIALAIRRGYRTLLLETGSMTEFEPARRLYGKYGFVERGPFGDYTPDPNSTFMEKTLPLTT